MTVALVPLLLALVVPLRPPLRPPALHAVSLPLAAPRRAAPPLLCDAPAAEKLDFDDALAGILSAAEAAGSLEPVLDEWLEQVDETFVPTLASKLEAVQTASKPDTDEVAKLSALLSAVERRSHERFTLAREQLQDLLGAGEINKLDAKLCKMINDGKLDAGFLYVLQQNVEAAREEADGSLLKRDTSRTRPGRVQDLSIGRRLPPQAAHPHPHPDRGGAREADAARPRAAAQAHAHRRRRAARADPEALPRAAGVGAAAGRSASERRRPPRSKAALCTRCNVRP